MMMPQYNKDSVVNKKIDIKVGGKLAEEILDGKFVLGETSVVIGTTRMENEDGKDVYVFDLGKTSFFTAFLIELPTEDGIGETRANQVSTKVFTEHADFGLRKLANAVSLNSKDREEMAKFLSTLGTVWSKLLDENDKCFREIEEVDSDGNKTGEKFLECKMEENDYKEHMKDVASKLLKPATDIFNKYTGRKFVANAVKEVFISSDGEEITTYKLKDSRTVR